MNSGSLGSRRRFGGTFFEGLRRLPITHALRPNTQTNFSRNKNFCDWRKILENFAKKSKFANLEVLNLSFASIICILYFNVFFKQGIINPHAVGRDWWMNFSLSNFLVNNLQQKCSIISPTSTPGLLIKFLLLRMSINKLANFKLLSLHLLKFQSPTAWVLKAK